MDCEGEGHLKGDVQVDNVITYISLQMASVQLLNVDKLLQPINLTRLEVYLYKNSALKNLRGVSGVFHIHTVYTIYSSNTH